MDAIESGIVKVPRTPVDDDADHDLVTYLRLWDFIGDKLPKRAAKDKVDGLAPAAGARRRAAQPAPQLREGLRALGARARSSTARRRRCSSSSAPTPSSPSSSTTGSPARQVEVDGEIVAHKPGNLALLSNVVDGKPLARPRTILIDSAQLESGEGMKADFKKAAAAEIAAFKAGVPPPQPRCRRRQDHRRRATARGDEHRRQEGQARRAGALRRQRLDAHRGLGRQHRHPHPRRARLPQPAALRAGRRPRPAPPLVRSQRETGYFEPEYANVYGIPFQFISSDKPVKDPLPPKPVHRGRSRRGPRRPADHVPEARRLPGRAPRRRDLARPRRRARVRDRTEHGAALGRDAGCRRRARARARANAAQYRPQEVAFALASASSTTKFNTVDDKRPWLFPRLVEMCRAVDRAEASTSPTATASAT